MAEETGSELDQTDTDVIAASQIYYDEYGLECSVWQWRNEATIVDQMNFARVYGKLSERQSAAVLAAIERNAASTEPLPPMGVAFWVRNLVNDPSFCPDLDS